MTPRSVQFSLCSHISTPYWHKCCNFVCKSCPKLLKHSFTNYILCASQMSLNFKLATVIFQDSFAEANERPSVFCINFISFWTLSAMLYKILPDRPGFIINNTYCSVFLCAPWALHIVSQASSALYI